MKPAPPATSAQRVHFLDVARALLMLLGIPFHAALVYTDSGWLVASPDFSSPLEFLLPLLNAFRMPGFFVIAGFFAAMLLERRPARQWLRSRAIRLGVPLITGLVVIVPLQRLMLDRAPPGVVHLPRHAESAIFSHLWFLPVLLMLCVVFAIGWRRICRWRRPDLPIWAIGLLIGLWSVAVAGTHNVFGLDFYLFDGLLDVTAVLNYAPYFLFGAAMRASPAIFARATQWHPATAAAGVISLVIFCMAWNIDGRGGLVASLLSGGVAAMCVTQVLLALLAKFLNRPSWLIDRLVDASFSIYLFHHPVVIALALAFLTVPLPPLLEWLLICVAALGISFVLHRALRRNRLALFLFNGVVRGDARPVLVPPPVPSEQQA